MLDGGKENKCRYPEKTNKQIFTPGKILGRRMYKNQLNDQGLIEQKTVVGAGFWKASKTKRSVWRILIPGFPLAILKQY